MNLLLSDLQPRSKESPRCRRSTSALDIPIPGQCRDPHANGARGHSVLPTWSMLVIRVGNIEEEGVLAFLTNPPGLIPMYYSLSRPAKHNTEEGHLRPLLFCEPRTR